MTGMTQAEAALAVPPASDGPASDSPAPQGMELRHLRYFVAVADAGTFTRAAERMYIAQPTLSQQIRRLEEIVGTPLLQRRREGVRLTAAGAVLLEDSRAVLSLVDRSVSRTRQAAGLGRPRLRFAVPPYLPESLAVEAASQLRTVAAAAGVEVTWLETTLDAEFSPIRERRADAGLGWTEPATEVLPAPLDAMHLGDFEPDAWVPDTHRAAARGIIGLDELAGLEVIHGPRRADGTYDSWLAMLRAHHPRFEFADPPFRRSLPMTLAFAASGARPAAVLTSPRRRIGTPAVPADPGLDTGAETVMEAGGMVPVLIERHPLTARASLVWNADLPRQLQQVLFDTADSIGL